MSPANAGLPLQLNISFPFATSNWSWTQVLTYLRLTEKPVGLLINFNVEYLVKGVRRVVNKF